MIFETGPYIKAALFCEKVLKEADGVLSLIRVVDRVAIRASGPNAPAEIPKFAFETNAVILLTAGQGRGRHEVKFEPEQPDGQKKPPFSASVLLEGEERTANVVIKMKLKLEMEGVYWFNVLLDDELLARIPLRVVYSRSSGVSPSAPGGSEN